MNYQYNKKTSAFTEVSYPSRSLFSELGQPGPLSPVTCYTLLYTYL